MRRWVRLVASLVLFLCGLLPSWQAVEAAPAAKPPPPGIVTSGIRIEPTSGTGEVVIDGVGRYRGVVEAKRSARGIAAVNEVPLEDYLRGVSEIPAAWPFEVQKAQAIAARTFALWQLSTSTGAHRAVGADLCATQSCQVYAGLEKERAPEAANWIAAVEATRGQVLLYNGAPIAAKYSSSNGGVTVPGGRPYLRAVKDPDDAYSPLHQWTSSVPLATLARALRVEGDPVSITRDGDLVVTSVMDPEGNVAELRTGIVEFRDAVNDAVPAPEGLPLAVPSLRFDLWADVDAGVAVLRGGGWGHGIGMSQWGALGKAMRGLRAPDILASYYAGLRPVALAPDKLPRTVRVVVAIDKPALTIRSVGSSRVVDAAGNPITVNGEGPWQVFRGPSAETVRVVGPPEPPPPPPAGEIGAPASVQAAAVAPVAISRTSTASDYPRRAIPAGAASLLLLSIAGLVAEYRRVAGGGGQFAFARYTGERP